MMSRFACRLLPLLLSAAIVRCASSSFTPAIDAAPAGRVRVHSGSAEDFHTSECVRIEASDTASAVDVKTRITRHLLAADIPLCITDSGAQVHVFYQAGPGVCIDCDAPPGTPRWGFALIALERNGKEIGSAEWQYAGGGTAETAAASFSRALIELLRGAPE